MARPDNCNSAAIYAATSSKLFVVLRSRPQCWLCSCFEVFWYLLLKHVLPLASLYM